MQSDKDESEVSGRITSSEELNGVYAVISAAAFGSVMLSEVNLQILTICDQGV